MVYHREVYIHIKHHMNLNSEAPLELVPRPPPSAALALSTMISSIFLLFDLAAFVVAGSWLAKWYKSSKLITSFPGPRGDPILGHLRLIAPHLQWIQFAEWGKKFGVCA